MPSNGNEASLSSYILSFASSGINLIRNIFNDGTRSRLNLSNRIGIGRNGRVAFLIGLLTILYLYRRRIVRETRNLGSYISRSVRSPVVQTGTLGAVIALGTHLLSSRMGYRSTGNRGIAIISFSLNALAVMYLQRPQQYPRRILLTGPILIGLSQINRLSPLINVNPLIGGLGILIVGAYGATSLGTGTRRAMIASSYAATTALLSMQSGSGRDLIFRLMRILVATNAGTFVGSEIGRYLMQRRYDRIPRLNQVSGREITRVGLMGILSSIPMSVLISYMWGLNRGEIFIAILSSLGGSFMGSGTYFGLVGNRLAGSNSIPLAIINHRPNLHGINITKRTITQINFKTHNIVVNYNGLIETLIRRQPINIPNISNTVVNYNDINDGLILSRVTMGLPPLRQNRRLLTFVSDLEYFEAAEDYLANGGNFNNVFNTINNHMQPSDVIALHGVGSHVFVPTERESTRYMAPEAFVKYLAHMSQNGFPYRFLQDPNNTNIPIKLLICFAGTPEFPFPAFRSLAQLIANRFRRVVYAGRTVIFPDPAHFQQSFEQFTPI